MYNVFVEKRKKRKSQKLKSPGRGKNPFVSFLRFTNWKKRRRFRIRKNLRFRWRFKRFLKVVTGRALFFVFVRFGRGAALNHNFWIRRKKGLTKKRYLFYRKKLKRFLTKVIYFYRTTTGIIRDYQKRKYLSFRRLFNLQFQTNLFYLRHFEINYKLNGFILLPIPYTFFYSFLLDQTFLWKTLMIELHTAYRR